jgi:structural maintenance of chromosome 1
MGRLVQLELEDFKSYRGLHVVGPLPAFGCVVGPNGAGKSNLMDAVCFALAARAPALRAAVLQDLVCRAGGARKASVRLVYEERAGSARRVFGRSVALSGACTYTVDGKDVSFAQYEAQLKDIGVMLKTRNFLVFQGDVESVAAKSPTELTRLIEEVSGSDALREEYEELLRSKEVAEEKTIFSLQNRKFHGNERRAVKDQRDEAELFLQRRQQLEELKTEHVLWQLLRAKSALESQQGTVERFRNQLEAAKKLELTSEEDVNVAKKELARISKIVASVEGEAQACYFYIH